MRTLGCRSSIPARHASTTAGNAPGQTCRGGSATSRDPDNKCNGTKTRLAARVDNYPPARSLGVRAGGRAAGRDSRKESLRRAAQTSSVLEPFLDEFEDSERPGRLLALVARQF